MKTIRQYKKEIMDSIKHWYCNDELAYKWYVTPHIFMDPMYPCKDPARSPEKMVLDGDGQLVLDFLKLHMER